MAAMKVRATLLFVAIIGIILILMARFDVIFWLLYMDIVGVIVVAMAIILFLWRLSATDTAKRFDSIGRQEAIIEYKRRDGTAIDVIGRRIYSGESFLDVPNLGLIEDLGKDCIFMKGGKKIRGGLENISFTEDPRYCNFTAELYRLGFTNSDDVYNVLNGYDLELMGRIYLNMKYDTQVRGAERLVKELKKKKPTKVIHFKPKDKSSIEQLVDKVLQHGS